MAATASSPNLTGIDGMMNRAFPRETPGDRLTTCRQNVCGGSKRHIPIMCMCRHHGRTEIRALSGSGRVSSARRLCDSVHRGGCEEDPAGYSRPCLIASSSISSVCRKRFPTPRSTSCSVLGFGESKPAFPSARPTSDSVG